MTVTKKIPLDLSNYMEGLMYETNARKDLCSYMVNSGMNETKQFEDYHKEYIEYYTKYELAKQEITNTYVAPEYPKAKWNLDFFDATLYIEVPDAVQK